ncbi:MAG: YceI family protein [Bacteroidetes bacterium]|nr:YceI family protein [Bacteroidota bacterium]
MKKIIALTSIIITFCTQGQAQIFMTRTGFIGFYSKTSLEDIKAENNQVYAVIDGSKKNLAFSVLLKGFIFRKELMQEHFNDNYVESDKYPKASFTGSYSGDINLTSNGSYKIMVKGNLTLHNITKPLEVPATLEINNGKLSGISDFKLKPEDFNITIPSIVRDKIENDITVHVKIDCNTSK